MNKKQYLVYIPNPLSILNLNLDSFLDQLLKCNLNLVIFGFLSIEILIENTYIIYCNKLIKA